ncbi:MAG TPA: CSLREA domain-containing protein, partial [Pyrinomonadaceae bacterium]|nr:CSLREA domain-containing protein [Pyrinomonadaceae bacterium]
MSRPFPTANFRRLLVACLTSFITLLAPLGSMSKGANFGSTSGTTGIGSSSSPAALAGRYAAPVASTAPASHRPAALPPGLNLVVNSIGDEPDDTLDGDCDTDLSGDGSQCTLRAAIQETNFTPGDDTITFSLPPNSIITLTSPLDDILESVKIDGPSTRVTVSGDYEFRVFSVLVGNVSISNLTITEGVENAGGGIFNVANLRILNSTFTDNHAEGAGAEGGAIYSDGGLLTIINSTISGNSSDGDGGGLLNCGTSTAVLDNVTITDNYADADGDESGSGGGIAQVSTNPITIRNTIVAGNFVGSSGTIPDDIGGTMDPGSDYNLIGDAVTSGGLSGVGENQVGVADPGLGLLANNGGPTRTHRLLPGSPAIDQGKNFATDEFSSPILTDQRGEPRPVDLAEADAMGGDGSDIGAYELQDETPQAGTTLIVNTSDDHDDGACTDTDCTLREAIILANSDSDNTTITFDIPGPGPHVIQLTDPLDELETDMSIEGPTAESVEVRGEGFYGIFAIIYPVVSISNLTISNGGEIAGGAIYNEGDLELTNCRF